MDSKIVRAYRFFREHAGYIVGRAGIGALSLARDEAWGEEQGLTFEWQDSDIPWDGDFPLPEGCALMDVVMRDKSGKVVGSLCSVSEFPGGPYFRVVEAELASEYRAEQEHEAERRQAAADQNIRTVDA